MKRLGATKRLFETVADQLNDELTSDLQQQFAKKLKQPTGYLEKYLGKNFHG